jgi:short-subunit dehydrogenase
MRRYRAALITGASSGIGAAFARELPEETDLVLVGRDIAALRELAASLANLRRQVVTVQADLSEDAGRRAAIDAAERQHIDLLINNAGLGHFGPAYANAPEHERAMVEVNVVAPVVLTRALLPGMLERADDAGANAAVIVVSSISAFLPVPRLATYAASKAFGLHYAEALATDLEDQPVDVLALCPGFTKTKFGQRSGMKPWMFHRAASPEKVARAALRGLGRKRIVLVGSGSLLAPVGARVLPRRFLSKGVVAAMKRLKRQSGA